MKCSNPCTLFHDSTYLGNKSLSQPQPTDDCSPKCSKIDPFSLSQQFQSILTYPSLSMPSQNLNILIKDKQRKTRGSNFSAFKFLESCSGGLHVNVKLNNTCIFPGSSYSSERIPSNSCRFSYFVEANNLLLFLLQTKNLVPLDGIFQS